LFFSYNLPCDNERTLTELFILVKVQLNVIIAAPRKGIAIPIGPGLNSITLLIIPA
jgi:hypothetical protein